MIRTLYTLFFTSIFTTCIASPALAISANQTTNFSSAGDGWNSVVGTIQASGGPAGAGDAFLQYASNGGGGSGSRMVIPTDPFTSNIWQGDYSALGITGISADLNNLGSTDLHLRLNVRWVPSGSGTSDPASTSFVTQTPVVLPAGSGWTNVLFNLSAADLVQIDGAQDLPTVLSNVFELRILSAVNLPNVGNGGGPQGDQVAATLGLDNITAVTVPEPSSLLALLAVAGPLACCRRR